MSIELTQSIQFKVKELVLVTKSGQIDISGIYEEIDIYDSMFLPVISGKVLVRDSVGLSGKLLFDGTESLLLEIVKDENSDIANFKKAFRIYKQSKRENQNQNSELYVLHFVSDELIYSDQQRINQSFENTYSEIVKKILENYLKIPRNNTGGIYENSSGVRKIVVPNLRPLEAIEWCAKRALDFNSSPNFMFFQNVVGYNFATLSTLLTKPEILDIKFEPKNLSDNDSISELSSARALEIVAQNDTIQRTRSGIDAGKFIGFDPITRISATKNISYGDHFSSMKHGNENPNLTVSTNREGLENIKNFDAKKTLSFFASSRQLSEYIKKNDPDSLTKTEAQENFIFQRKAIMNNLMQKRVRVVMPGNFQLSSGFNVNLMAPNFGTKEKGEDNEDKSISGKYIIVASRQIIGFDKHQTVIEIATTSSGNDFIPAGNREQTSSILSY